tara:strand:- start:722 stop:1390 length:669 start_codon:yes stop_codon:yes gene_type:complete
MDDIKLSQSSVEIKARYLPNLGILEGALPKQIIKNLWNEIEEAKKKPESIKSSLAGNITESLILNSTSDNMSSFTNQILPKFVDTYLKNFNGPIVKFISPQKKDYKFILDKIWVNFQNKHEFNPMHDHKGALSFVIWMKIPTSYKAQKDLPFVKASTVEDFVSNFCFVYTDIIGNLKTLAYGMEQSIEGTMVMFPSRLNHQVYPFFESDDERISISGNLGLE